MRSDQAHHGIANRVTEPTNLPISPLFERQFKPSLAILEAQNSNPYRFGGLPIDNNRLLESLQGRLTDLALNLSHVGLLHLALWVEKT